jgi:hypothetical protein
MIILYLYADPGRWIKINVLFNECSGILSGELRKDLFFCLKPVKINSENVGQKQPTHEG